MSYLSRVEIDYKKPSSLRDLKSVGAFHNWVE
ncbi:type I-E CRISPR-associated protein Cas6/Cse3/CasE, partial [Bifidobacteriaceae bacterium WP012]